MPVARELEKNWTRFTPHYIVWVCPRGYRSLDECQSQCIHKGRYCTPDPDGDLENGYSGKDVVQVDAPSVIHKYCHPFKSLLEDSRLLPCATLFFTTQAYSGLKLLLLQFQVVPACHEMLLVSSCCVICHDESNVSCTYLLL